MTSIVPEVPPNASVGMRLKAAIAHKGYQTLRAFAAANDLKYETVMSQANDKRRLTEERAESYAPLLDVTPGWLLHGTVNGDATGVYGPVPVTEVASPKWMQTVGDGESKARHIPHAVDFPIAVPVPRASLFAVYCDDAIGTTLQRGAVLICLPVPAAAKVHAPKLGYLCRQRSDKFSRVLPFFHVGRDGQYVSPSEPDKPMPLEPTPPEGVEVLGVVLAAWIVAV